MICGACQRAFANCGKVFATFQKIIFLELYVLREVKGQEQNPDFSRQDTAKQADIPSAGLARIFPSVRLRIRLPTRKEFRSRIRPAWLWSPTCSRT